MTGKRNEERAKRWSGPKRIVADPHIMPPAKGLCVECACNHAPSAPHNRDSIYYQFAFHAKHGRWPTWTDAMAHCTPEVQRLWKAELTKRAIRID